MYPSTLIDTHAHITDNRLWTERAEVIENALRAGVGGIISVGYDRVTSERALEIAAAFPYVGPTVGVHPTSIVEARPEDFDAVAGWAAMPEVIAVGETGLDFYWDKAPPERQREVFRWHLDLARSHGLPVSVHSRRAETAVLDILEDLPPPGAAIHCFGGSKDEARRAMDLGYYIGVDGPVTFKKSVDLQELVRWLPLDRLLLETDCPYLAPHPHRGKRNEPAYLALIAASVAVLKGVPVEEITQATTTNAFRLFPRMKTRIEAARGGSEEEPSMRSRLS